MTAVAARNLTIAILGQAPGISIIVPALNEAGTIEACLKALQPVRRQGHELIVVDGGSTDNTVLVSQPFADRVLHTSKGRACQMQAGADVARGAVLWFLHADTLVPDNPDSEILAALNDGNRRWGYFNSQFHEHGMLLNRVSSLMNLRSRITQIATGDQGIFVTRELFEQVNGFQPIPLMEDIALSRTLKKVSPPARIRQPLVTSARRWKKHGVIRTIFLMWSLRLAYFLGVSPVTLENYYKAHYT
jgi:rSAM/selenodomain-associated transferase 2